MLLSGFYELVVRIEKLTLGEHESIMKKTRIFPKRIKAV